VGNASVPCAGPSWSCIFSPVSFFGLTSPSVSQRGTFVREDEPETVHEEDADPEAALYSARMLVTQTVRTPTIVPFADEHLDGGALLLAERHRAHRLAEPGLDPRYEAPGA